MNIATTLTESSIYEKNMSVLSFSPLQKKSKLASLMENSVLISMRSSTSALRKTTALGPYSHSKVKKLKHKKPQEQGSLRYEKKSRQNWEVVLTQHSPLPQLRSREVSLPFKVQHSWLRQGHRWNQHGELTPEQFCFSAVAPLPDCSSFLGAEDLLPHFSQFDYWETSKAGATALPPSGWWLRCPSWQWVKNITCHLAWPYPVQIQNEHQGHPAHRRGLDGAWCCLHCQSCTMGRGKHGKRFC